MTGAVVVWAKKAYLATVLGDARLDDAGYDDQRRLGKSTVTEISLNRQRHRANTEHSQKGGTALMKFVNGFQSLPQGIQVYMHNLS